MIGIEYPVLSSGTRYAASIPAESSGNDQTCAAVLDSFAALFFDCFFIPTPKPIGLPRKLVEVKGLKLSPKFLFDWEAPT
jgi:hypothetical protein